MTNDKQAKILASSFAKVLEEIGGKNSKDVEQVLNIKIQGKKYNKKIKCLMHKSTLLITHSHSFITKYYLILNHKTIN
jgi:hypothetical protein